MLTCFRHTQQKKDENKKIMKMVKCQCRMFPSIFVRFSMSMVKLSLPDWKWYSRLHECASSFHFHFFFALNNIHFTELWLFLLELRKKKKQKPSAAQCNATKSVSQFFFSIRQLKIFVAQFFFFLISLFFSVVKWKWDNGNSCTEWNQRRNLSNFNKRKWKMSFANVRGFLNIFFSLDCCHFFSVALIERTKKVWSIRNEKRWI